MNIKLIPNTWITKSIPISVIQHRLLVTDPAYKFVLYALIHGRANIAVRQDSDGNDYYDIANMSITQDAATSPEHWLSYINNNYNLNLTTGLNFQSLLLPELIFDLEEDRDTFDLIYSTLINDQENTSSEGVNIVVDFGIKLSGGFIRNKLGFDTKEIKNWILDGLNFSLLKTILYQEIGTENYKIHDIYKDIYSFTKNEIELIESLGSKNNNLYPKDSNNNNIFWYYIDRYTASNSLDSKESLFGFKLDGVLISEVSSRNISFALNQYNRPMFIQTQMKFDSQNQKVYVTSSGPSNPISFELGPPRNSVVIRTDTIQPSKNIQTKINNHIYMVNKK